MASQNNLINVKKKKNPKNKMCPLNKAVYSLDDYHLVSINP